MAGHCLECFLRCFFRSVGHVSEQREHYRLKVWDWHWVPVLGDLFDGGHGYDILALVVGPDQGGMGEQRNAESGLCESLERTAAFSSTP